MLISDIWTVEVAKRLDRTLENPLLSFNESRTLVVVVETDEGTWGLGEAEAAHHPAPGLRALIEEQLRPAAIGWDAWDATGLFERLRRSVTIEMRGLLASALAGVDIALWDLRGKVLGAPLHRLLGAAAKPVQVYASGGIYSADKTVDDLVAEMSGYVERGFRMIKLKVGGAQAGDDFARVQAVREAVGPQIRIAVDGCYGLTSKEALRLGTMLDALDIEFFEAPVPEEDLVGLRQVRSNLPIPIAGNELASTRFAWLQLMSSECLDLIQPNVTICGGIGELLKITGMASAMSLPVTLQASASALTLAASLQVGAALPNLHSVEFHQVHQVLFDALPSDFFRLVDGCLTPPSGPGIGLPLDIEHLRAFRA